MLHAWAASLPAPRPTASAPAAAHLRGDLRGDQGLRLVAHLLQIAGLGAEGQAGQGQGGRQQQNAGVHGGSHQVGLRGVGSRGGLPHLDGLRRLLGAAIGRLQGRRRRRPGWPAPTPPRGGCRPAGPTIVLFAGPMWDCTPRGAPGWVWGAAPPLTRGQVHGGGGSARQRGLAAVELLKRKENSAGIGAGPLKGCVCPVLRASHRAVCSTRPGRERGAPPHANWRQSTPRADPAMAVAVQQAWAPGRRHMQSSGAARRAWCGPQPSSRLASPSSV